MRFSQSCSNLWFGSQRPSVHSTHVVWPGAGLLPLLVRLLYPKMRKRSGRLGGKGAPGSARSAILNYLAALDSMELAPLVQLFLQPISAAFQQQRGVEVPDSTSALRSACAAPFAAPIHILEHLPYV